VAIDLDDARQTIVDELPVSSSWSVLGTPFRHDFSAARETLVPLREHIDAEDFDDAWEPLVVFGTSDFADAGGATPWLALHRVSGAVVGIDLERDGDPLFVLNSGLQQFIETFTYLDRFLGNEQPLPPNAEATLQRIDPDAYDDSDWKQLLEYLRDE
jgi:hypothetical protein